MQKDIDTEKHKRLGTETGTCKDMLRHAEHQDRERRKDKKESQRDRQIERQTN